MMWRIDVEPHLGLSDPEAGEVLAALREAGGVQVRAVRRADIYLIETRQSEEVVRRLAREVFADPVTARVLVRPARSVPPSRTGAVIFRRPGVMDPVELSALRAIADAGGEASRVRTGRRYEVEGEVTWALLHRVLVATLANEVVDEVVPDGPVEALSLGSSYVLELRVIPLRPAGEEELDRISREGGLALSREEMRAIQEHFRGLGRDPTDVELETLAQTWSEHCKHKTFTGVIRVGEHTVENLLRSTIVRATEQIAAPWCLSVFRDNAGAIEFDEEYAVCFKVETHNHPSAIDPYGGAGTGVGGVIRDVMGFGLGARPIFSIDVFCVGPPDTPAAQVPPGVIHPRRLLRGVVAGVRDYGNRMGIPTVAGAVCFDPRFTFNPLVFCGTAGLIPRDKIAKAPRPGDRIVVAGGRTGRDGIHGATFSSLERTEDSEQRFSAAVQIGNAIVQKRLLEAVLEARDRGLFTCITDCGAGGLSSAVGEMGASLGAVVDLDRVPLKYEGLSYAEIWISEAQERMVLAVPPERLEELLALFAAEEVEATDIGSFADDRRLRLRYQGQVVADLAMEFLHRGMPVARRRGVPAEPREEPVALEPAARHDADLLAVLRDPNIGSKEWIVRQYDHEVQGGSVVKPLVGVRAEGPSDAAVVRPRLDSYRAVAVGLGLAPRYGDLDPYAMAASAIDEAVRNVVAVGARPDRIALLDNFAWGSTENPVQVGALVRAAEACRDVAVAFRTPFISGKDSLNNEYCGGGRRIPVAPTLLISALGIVEDARRCVTSDAKEPGNLLALVGWTDAELGASAFLAARQIGGGRIPRVVPERSAAVFRAVHAGIAQGLVRSCHDLSEGGLAVAAVEMAIGGELGVRIDLARVAAAAEARLDAILLFSESNGRFLVEVRERDARAFERLAERIPIAWVGGVTSSGRMVVRGLSGNIVMDLAVAELRQAWKEPLAW